MFDTTGIFGDARLKATDALTPDWLAANAIGIAFVQVRLGSGMQWIADEGEVGGESLKEVKVIVLEIVDSFGTKMALTMRYEMADWLQKMIAWALICHAFQQGSLTEEGES